MIGKAAPLTAERADAIREAGAQAAAEAIRKAMGRHGETPEVMAAVIEGLFSGAAAVAWRNRLDTTTRKGFVRIFSGLLAKAMTAATRSDR